MPDESTQSIVVDAPPERIMAVIADLESYPEWAKAVRETEVLERDADDRAVTVRFTLDAGPVQDVYTLKYDWAPDGLMVNWHLVQGQMQRAQRGTYQLRPLEQGEQTEVTYTLSVELALPMIGLLRRKAEKMIMDIALKELKRRSETA
ncbi:MAG: cyclase [Actinophytocola sp.]|nr:cyclase [Actinophytocola sp.]